MRIVISGGAGFVGSHLCDYYLAQGSEVVAVDNFITGSLANIAHLNDHPNFTLVEQDVNEPFLINGTIDVVLHFASPASPPDYLKYPIETLKVGSLGTIHTLEIARQNNAKYLLASTSEVYGDPLEHPQSENYAGNVSTTGPRSVYDEAKRFAEAMVMAYHRQYDVDTRIVRIFNTYGPRMRLDDGRVVPNFIAQSIRGEQLTVYGDGTQTRCFQYVDDLVLGIDRLLQSEYHEPVNIGTTREISVLEFAEIVNEIANNTAGMIVLLDQRIKDDPQTRRPDTRRAKEVLGWEPGVSLEDGLLRTITFFRSQIVAGS